MDKLRTYKRKDRSYKGKKSRDSISQTKTKSRSQKATEECLDNLCSTKELQSSTRLQKAKVNHVHPVLNYARVFPPSSSNVVWEEREGKHFDANMKHYRFNRQSAPLTSGKYLETIAVNRKYKYKWYKVSKKKYEEFIRDQRDLASFEGLCCSSKGSLQPRRTKKSLLHDKTSPENTPTLYEEFGNSRGFSKERKERKVAKHRVSESEHHSDSGSDVWTSFSEDSHESYDEATSVSTEGSQIHVNWNKSTTERESNSRRRMNVATEGKDHSNKERNKQRKGRSPSQTDNRKRPEQNPGQQLVYKSRIPRPVKPAKCALQFFTNRRKEMVSKQTQTPSSLPSKLKEKTARSARNNKYAKEFMLVTNPTKVEGSDSSQKRAVSFKLTSSQKTKEKQDNGRKKGDQSALKKSSGKHIQPRSCGNNPILLGTQGQSHEAIASLKPDQGSASAGKRFFGRYPIWLEPSPEKIQHTRSDRKEPSKTSASTSSKGLFPFVGSTSGNYNLSRRNRAITPKNTKVTDSDLPKNKTSQQKDRAKQPSKLKESPSFFSKAKEKLCTASQKPPVAPQKGAVTTPSPRDAPQLSTSCQDQASTPGDPTLEKKSSGQTFCVSPQTLASLDPSLVKKQKSPISPQQASIFPQQAPIFPHVRPVIPQIDPLLTQNKKNVLQKKPATALKPLVPPRLPCGAPQNSPVPILQAAGDFCDEKEIKTEESRKTNKTVEKGTSMVQADQQVVKSSSKNDRPRKRSETLV